MIVVNIFYDKSQLTHLKSESEHDRQSQNGSAQTRKIRNRQKDRIHLIRICLNRIYLNRRK